jgi:hypothetical protein
LGIASGSITAVGATREDCINAVWLAKNHNFTNKRASK